jgi:gamma-glutamyltranspeptidase / glutathione hydrolase
MKRRSFLKAAGGAGATAFIYPPNNTSAFPSTESEINMDIDLSRVADRNSDRSTVITQNGMVCTAQPLASQAGLDILKSGGNAIDAAICANAVLSVVEPMSCGPGGDLFAIVWIEKEKKLYGLNASGRAPLNWSLEAIQQLGLIDIPTFGPLSWSVPGCVSGWKELANRFGTRKEDSLLGAATDYAQNGFPVSPIISQGWRSANNKNYPTLAQTFAPQNNTPGYGDIFTNKGMAEFMTILVRDGFDAFYKGEIAELIVKFSKAQNGRFSIKDFQNHTADWIDPVSSSYRGYDVWELPPNGQGIAALQILNMLENFDITSLKPNSAEQLHLLIEAKKLAFEDRAVYYADMDFAKVPLQQLISKEYGKERAKLINPNRAAQQVNAGRLKSGADTTYLCAADKEGNMISLIQSVFHGWGSKMVPDNLGFALQNRGKLFSLDPKSLNKLEPGKRPFHTIIPAFVTKDNKPKFAFGVMGGDFQPQGHSQVLMNLIDFDMSPQQAGEQPRISHFESSTPMGDKMVGGGKIGFERGFSKKVKLELAEMGHKIRSSIGAYGGYQGIWKKEQPQRYFGGTDPRKDGCASGY